eukprot:scaffold27716_cov148-Skeletonema_menzelii.AAC.4
MRSLLQLITALPFLRLRLTMPTLYRLLEQASLSYLEKDMISLLQLPYAFQSNVIVEKVERNKSGDGVVREEGRLEARVIMVSRVQMKRIGK